MCCTARLTTEGCQSAGGNTERGGVAHGTKSATLNCILTPVMMRRDKYLRARIRPFVHLSNVVDDRDDDDDYNNILFLQLPERS